MKRYNRPAKQPTTQQEKRLKNIENMLQNPLKIDLKSIKKQPQIHLKGSLGPLWAPKGCHRNEGVFLGPLFIDFCSILVTLGLMFSDFLQKNAIKNTTKFRHGKRRFLRRILAQTRL